MKTEFINTFKKDDKIDALFMLKSKEAKKDKNGNYYLHAVLGDKTGEIIAKKWNVAESEFPALKELKEKDIVRVKGVVGEYASQLQFTIQTIHRPGTDETYEMRDFIKAAPENSEDMYAYIYARTKEFKDEDFKKLCQKVLEDNRERLMYYPAAAKNHHAQFGGLLYHMKRMIMTGEKICEVYKNLNRDLVITGVIFHDMEKLNEIQADADGIATGYSFEGQLLGHIIQGIKAIDKLALEVNLDSEKRIMLEHMVLSHHYEPEFGSPKKPLFPEAEILHYLDIIDARMFDMEQALDGVEPGEFTERVWTLDNRKLYKVKEQEND